MDKIINVLENKLNYMYFDFNNSELYYNLNYNRFSSAERKRQRDMKDNLYKELEYIKALIRELGFTYKWDIANNCYIISLEEEI